VAARINWAGATVHRVVYCTALIDGATNPNKRLRQDTYLRAIQAGGSVDVVELGHYAARVKRGPLATEGPTGHPVITTSAWPVMVRDAADRPPSLGRRSWCPTPIGRRRAQTLTWPLISLPMSSRAPSRALWSSQTTVTFGIPSSRLARSFRSERSIRRATVSQAICEAQHLTGLEGTGGIV